MATPAQTLSNRQNAKRSTGPRTQHGKRQSSFNSLRHGLTGQTVVLPGEDAGAYAALRAALWRDLAPQGSAEEILLQTICDTQWRLERARTLEANLISLAHYEEIPRHLKSIQDGKVRSALITAHGYDKREKALRNLQLQEARLQRTLFRSFAELNALQETRRDLEFAQLRQAVEARAACRIANKPFHPETSGFVFTEAQLDREEARRPAKTRPQNPDWILEQRAHGAEKAL